MATNSMFGLLGASAYREAMEAQADYQRQFYEYHRNAFPAYKAGDLQNAYRRPDPVYTPTVHATDWIADRAATLRQARIGLGLIVAIVLAVAWNVWRVFA